MQVNNLNERITVQSLVKTKQANGEVTKSWKDEYTIWADAFPMSAGEDYEASSKMVSDNYRFLIRHRDDIDETNRIGFEGRFYDVKSINQYYKSGRNNILEVKAEYNEGQYGSS